MTYRNYVRILSLLVISVLPLAASEMAMATYTVTQNGANSWHYSLTLNDTGTTNVGTFWFAWVPGQDYMPTIPTNITAPTNWMFHVTGSGNAVDGSAIQWVANAGFAETAGETLSGFSFDSGTSPAEMAGLNQFFTGPQNPVATAFVYGGAPFSDPGFQLVAAAVAAPEPSSILLTLLGCGVIFGRFRRRT